MLLLNVIGCSSNLRFGHWFVAFQFFQLLHRGLHVFKVVFLATIIAFFVFCPFAPRRFFSSRRLVSRCIFGFAFGIGYYRWGYRTVFGKFTLAAVLTTTGFLR